VTYRDDDEAARARADVLARELARTRAKTAAVRGQLERHIKWPDGFDEVVDIALVVVMWIVAVLLFFAILYVPRVLIGGRW